jgi:hypothetical protein
MNFKMPFIVKQTKAFKSPKIVVAQTLREQNRLQDDRYFSMEQMEQQLTNIMNSKENFRPETFDESDHPSAAKPVARKSPLLPVLSSKDLQIDEKTR